MSSYTWLSEPLHFLDLGVGDEAVVKDHKRLQAQHFPSHRLQQQSGMAVGEVVTEQTGVFKTGRLWRETDLKSIKNYKLPAWFSLHCGLKAKKL